MNLLLCTSQQENNKPYRFAATGIQVYSFEEALYHVYHYWKQSVDDVVDPDFASWVNDALGLSFIASKIKEVADIDGFGERMLAFLALTEYFSESEIRALKPEFEQWEKRLEWETYKERADEMVNRGEPDKAITLYRRALQFEENVPVLNNLSVAYMQTEAYDEASRYLERARELDEDNWELALNHAEALILAKRFDKAGEAIQFAAAHTNKAEAIILYLRGELALRMGQYAEAIPLFEQAIAISAETQYIFRLADTYARRRQFERALQVLEQHVPSTGHDVSYLVKEAELHAQADNVGAAIMAIERAISLKSGLPDLWVLLARYYRMNYDLSNAEKAIKRAISLDSSSERARLENARIMKRMGNTKAYQLLLKDILAEVRQQYRDATLG